MIRHAHGVGFVVNDRLSLEVLEFCLDEGQKAVPGHILVQHFFRGVLFLHQNLSVEVDMRGKEHKGIFKVGLLQGLTDNEDTALDIAAVDQERVKKPIKPCRDIRLY